MGKQNIFTIGAGVIGAAAFKQDASFFPDGFQFFLGKKRPKIQQYVGCGAQRPRQRAQQQNIRVGTGRLPFGHRRGGNAHGLGKLFLRQSLLSAQCLDGFVSFGPGSIVTYERRVYNGADVERRCGFFELNSSCGRCGAEKTRSNLRHMFRKAERAVK